MGWNHFLGDSGEAQAARFLRKQGYRILDRNHRNRVGELDLIARDRDRLVFVEVKTRSSKQAGHPAEAVDRTKQRQIVRTALAYLHERQLLESPVRFDVIAVLNDPDSKQVRIEHYQNAFEPDFHGQFFC